MAEKRNGREEVSVSQAAYMEALQQKINNYSSLLYRIAFLQLKNNQDAEDVVQETFYRLVKNRKEFETPEHEKAWLIKVTLNGCRKVWRSAWYRHTDIVPAGELPEGGAAGRKAGRNGWRDGGRYSGKREKPGNYGSGFKASEKIQGSNPFVLFPADERQRDRRCHRKKGIDDNVAADERQGIVEKKSEGGVSV